MLDDLYSFIKNEKNLAEEFIKQHSDKRKVFLYGAGMASIWYIEFLKRNNICIEGIIVSDAINQSMKKNEIPIICIDDISLDASCEIVIATPKYKEEIINKLSMLIGIDNIFSFETEIYCTFVHDVDILKKYYLSNFDRICNMYDDLEDDYSKITLLNFIKGRVSGNQDYYKEIRVEEPYYSPDIITLSQEEVLVELGSNNGETLLDFLNKVDRKYKKCICFEPDPDCIQKLKNIIERESGNIELIELGAYDTRRILKFEVDEKDENHATAHISENGICIEVDAVDNWVNDKITFLKMDIEGSEINALQGCKKTIQKYAPKLAVSVYHNNEDLLDIYEFIRTFPIQYKIYLRHYNHSATDTILYATL